MFEYDAQGSFGRLLLSTPNGLFFCFWFLNDSLLRKKMTQYKKLKAEAKLDINNVSILVALTTIILVKTAIFLCI